MAVLIVSIKGDQSTFNVIEWLRFYHSQVYILCQGDELFINAVELSDDNNVNFKINGDTLSLQDIDSIWYRRGNIKVGIPDLKFLDGFLYEEEFKRHLLDEELRLREYINIQLSKRKTLGNIFRMGLNKLNVLKRAQDFGILIPKSLVTSSKAELESFRRKFESIISKPISEAIVAHDIDVGVVTYYTHILEDENFNKLEDNFTISLFQENIRKKYELRIFFLNGKFYPMAIFSQQDEGTVTDFRQYNFKKPNRTVPYNLPHDIQVKLLSLMESLNLNTGSIDMAVNENNDYVFFEINPIGQYGMTSRPCNYFLDRKIANYLLNNEGEQKKIK
jgi:ATP-GRASP peptide maturase of grasp-with-spasm system